MKLIVHKPDTFGAFASTLCMLHCLTTPLLFIAQTCPGGYCETAPAWWRGLDYVFLVISFFAVYRSVRTTSRNFMKPALWISWITLFAVIVNEKLELLPLPEIITYAAAFTLVILHLYNLKYCQCKTGKCCVKS